MPPAIGPEKEYIIYVKTYWDRLGEEKDSCPRHALKFRKKIRVFSLKRRPVFNKKMLVGRSLYMFRNIRFEPYTATQLYSPWPNQFLSMNLTSFVQKIGMRLVLYAIAVKFEFNYAQTQPRPIGFFCALLREKL